MLLSGGSMLFGGVYELGSGGDDLLNGSIELISG